MFVILEASRVMLHMQLGICNFENRIIQSEGKVFPIAGYLIYAKYCMVYTNKEGRCGIK